MVVIKEPVETLVHFKKGRVNLLRFLWKGRVIKMKRVTGLWRKKLGEEEIICLSGVSEDGDYFELSFSTKSLIWCIEKVEASG
jgi:hypothetical protein